MSTIAPEYVSIIWVGAAFAGGFLFRLLTLPPMIGFLAAGFILNFLGLTQGTLNLDVLADYGIILLLFTIGLKLDLKSLARPEIWGGTFLHVLACVVLFSLLLLAGSTLGFVALAGMDPAQALLLGFALSFSSTVYAVKTLEEHGEISALHGRIAIGILIMQDILAVLFVTFSKGEFPSLWALGLPLLLLGVRPLFFYVMDHVDHGELLVLAGFFVSVVIGATSFTLAGLKPDLGALVFGILVSGHPRASEMSRALYVFKDLFLVAFFMKIGLFADPSWNQVWTALALLLFLPFKSLLYMLILTRFKLRARTAFHSTLVLSNFSIFGLLVVSISVKEGWLAPEWLVILSLALTFSFVLLAPLSSRAHSLYDRFAQWLAWFETEGDHPDEVPVDIGDTEILICGMGRIGSGAYDVAVQRPGTRVLGLDHDRQAVEEQRLAGRRVLWADATDSDFWHRVNLSGVKLIMLCLPHHQANIFALEELTGIGFSGKIAATALFDDQLEQLLSAGASMAYNVYAEAGAGYGRHVCESLGCGA